MNLPADQIDSKADGVPEYLKVGACHQSSYIPSCWQESTTWIRCLKLEARLTSQR